MRKSDNATNNTAKPYRNTFAEDKSAVLGAGVAGLACGPGAPVCVTLGAFVGGALAAIGIDSFWW